jgi:ABC-type nitrate/sulfonate/bicarbonate transport system ATPase subunit
MSVEVERVSLTYAGGVEALQAVSLRARPGEVVAVVGPSGCGKTTLLELICGLLEPDSGSAASAPAALMAQRDLLLPWASALDNACLALRVGPNPVDRDQARDRARPWFTAFGLAGFEQARPGALSGGMRQRVAFLRTLLSGKPVLCLDEPFGALDAITRADMQSWLSHVLASEAADGDSRTVVLVTHDVEEAVILADHVVVMSPRPGRVVDTIAVDLPRPRSGTDAGVVALRARAVAALRSAA